MKLKKATLFTAAFAATSFAAIAPDLPIAGWATQNGGTTGGAGKTVVTVSTTSDLRKYAEAGNHTIYVKPGTYTVASKSAIEVASNVTIYGYRGAILKQTYTGTANEDNTVLNITGDNVIIRNIIVEGAGAIDKDAGDCLHVKGGTRVWIDHVEVYDGEDGNLDVINGANYVTISWSKFHYTSASSEHQFSNLIGNSDSKTTDSGKLKTTLHHNWWADGSKERMPRVRFGQVHVANNLFDSDDASHCVRAAYKADLRVEGNVFIGVKKPIDLYDGDYTAVYSNGNYTEGTSGNSGSGTNSAAFSPSYSMGITDVSTQAKAYALRDSIQLYAGANLPDPETSTTVTPVSSSAAASSSSKASASSSSISANVSSSSSVSGAASLTKHGAGSSTQTVSQGEEIASFYYTIENASGATVEGLPDGISGTQNGNDFVISGAVSSTASPGTYTFTVTTVGAASNATKTGSITVTASGSGQSSSSEASPESSSSSIAGSSSSAAETVSSNSKAGSSSSEGTESIFSKSRRLEISSAVITSAETARFTAPRSGSLKVTFYSATGIVAESQTVHVEAGENSLTVSKGNLAPGFYILNVRGGGANLSRRVKIQ